MFTVENTAEHQAKNRNRSQNPEAANIDTSVYIFWIV